MVNAKFGYRKNFYLLGLLLLISTSLLLFLSFSFANEESLKDKPVALLVAILTLSSVIYLFAINFRFYPENTRRALFYIFIIGLLIRIVTLFSFPMLEDDYFRYLWDGSVTANKINPYKYSPEQVLTGETGNPILESLAVQSGQVIDKINHPYLSTIYPPVSQLFFAISFKLAPFDINFFRVLLLFFDLITFFLIVVILRDLKLSSLNVSIYWWNPLLVNVIFNAGHYDSIIFPFVLSAFILAYRNKHIFSLVSLALGVGVKIWPLFLFPVLLRSCHEKISGLIKPALVFLVVTIAVFLPLIFVKLDGSSGFIAYGQSWENNSSLFRIILYLTEGFLSLKNIHPGHAQSYSRIIISILLVIWVLYQTIKYDHSRLDLFRRSLFIIAALFLLSPTQFPWYYIWLLPMLAVVPRFSLLLLTSLLPLYYLRFYFEPRGLIDLFNNYIVWIEFVPVWVLLAIESARGKLFRNF